MPISPLTVDAATAGSLSDSTSTRELPEYVETVIIGAGFGGLAMVDRLKRKRPDASYIVVDSGADVGGTWRDNRYPGCACDVPSALYSLEGYPDPEWSRSFGQQDEIFSYLRGVAKQMGLEDRLYTHCEVTAAKWSLDDQQWTVSTSRGTVRAKFVVAATGALSTPQIPQFPGLDTFQGTYFHSAQWDYDIDLRDKKIGVVGTGASAIQFVPEIVGPARHTTVFQRTPSWLLPRVDLHISDMRKRLYRRIPLTQKAIRSAIYYSREFYVVGFTIVPRVLRLVEALSKAMLFMQVRDRSTRKKLSPSYSIGCKRVLLSNTWWKALDRKDVTLVDAAVDRIDETGIVDSLGNHHRVDHIVFGTGFTPTEPPIAHVVFDSDGKSLAEHWDGSPQALRGTTIAGFENLFMLFGPNTNLGHSSIVYMLESQADYVIEIMALLDRESANSITPTEQAHREYNKKIDKALSHTVWNTGGCQSYFFDAKGRNALQWPTFTFRFRRETQTVDPAEYSLR